MISRAGWWTWIPSATPLQPKKWSAHFWIMFNFWWLAGLVNGLEPHLPPISSQRMKCSFLDFQLLMIRAGRFNFWWCSFLAFNFWIGQVGRWTRTQSATPLQPKKWNACFCIMFNFWWSAGLVDGLEPHPLPFSSQKMKCSFLYYIQLLMFGRAGQWTWTPSTSSLKPKKMKCSFLDYV